ncbi:MAG: CpXC domain-containing protein [Acetobacteraceae bacterium]
MSLFNHANVTCPHCDAQFDVEVVASVNADRRPDLRQQILDGAFQAETCGTCGTVFRLPPSFSYIDVGRSQWIMAYPANELENWVALEAQAADIFATAYGAAAPPAARAIGADLVPRITFGWPAMREKLLCLDLGLDDAILELLKAAVMRTVQKPPFADTTELRLLGAEHGALALAWLNSMTEATLAGLEVPRDIYTDIANDTAAWAAMRTRLIGHSFTDLNRLLVPALAA